MWDKIKARLQQINSPKTLIPSLKELKILKYNF